MRGAFGCMSKLNFNCKTGCTCNEPTAVKVTLTAIPIHEENISTVAGQLKESGIDVDALGGSFLDLCIWQNITWLLKHCTKIEIKVVIFDRMPSIDIPHLSLRNYWILITTTIADAF